MKIELKKRDGIYLVIIGGLILIILGYFNSTSRNHMNNDFDEPGRGQMGMGIEPNNSSNLNGSDSMFTEMMIPHHQQAVEMSDLALSKSTNPSVLDLAKRIKNAQSAEIIQMQSWIGSSESNSMMSDHSGHSMGGMLTDEELSKLESASGAEFDKLFLEGMIVHHEGAIDMSRMIKDTTTKEINAFGVNVVEVQSAEIREMKEILENL